MRKLLLTSALVAAFAGSAIVVAGPVVNGQAISDARIDAVVKMMEAKASRPTRKRATWSRINWSPPKCCARKP